VIEERDPHDVRSPGELLCDGDVVGTRGGIAGRMVVRDDDPGGRSENGRLQNLARVDDRGVQGADRHDFDAEHGVPGREQKHHEMLAVAACEPSPEQARGSRPSSQSQQLLASG
jgi:hypothetical protein